ncbi:hypothetical protein [Type-D symbiont of Plautia stali]|uniref:hypothetical protein n=1 Tax=Type-D symbiont of Plautia stali TaxID=1560356 RepID=UPI001428C3D7|nr:hypothetical protein [Type-D symbiont of Plautia stali]
MLPALVGDQGRSGFVLALTLAAAATDTGQQGQLVVTPCGDNLACVQLSVRPADPVAWPQDRISRYPLAWLGASACLITLFGLLPPPSVRLALWPWLAGGFIFYVLLLTFAVPLALKLWHYRLDDEWLNPDVSSHE